MLDLEEDILLLRKHEKLKTRFYWPGMKKDVDLYCSQYTRCGARKAPPHNAKARLMSMRAGFPFERIAMDVVGPLPKTERGNRYLLVIVDYYTRWPEAYAIAHQDAHSIASKLVTEYFSRYGSPYCIHSDQGANFESNLLREICNLYDIKKTRTTSYHPQGDGFVERMNRTLIDTIALVAKDAKEHWDLRIGLALMAIRSAVQSSTGLSPHFLLFGREMRLPADLVYETVQEESVSPIESVTQLRGTLRTVHETVIANMGCKQKHQNDYYDRLTHGVRYNKGDHVWLLNKNPNLLNNKFHDRWLGSYEVLSRRSDLVYDIRDPNTGKIKRVHFNLLKATRDQKKSNKTNNNREFEAV